MNARVIKILAWCVVAFAPAACKQSVELERKLSSFEVTLFSPVGTPDARCILAGTPTTGIDLTGCPEYVRDASMNTVIRVAFEARAIDNRGDLLETYNSLATVKLVPGNVDAAFQRVRFTNGMTNTGDNRPNAAFRASFADTYLWIIDDQAPPRTGDVPGLGAPCSSRSEDTCTNAGLACVNSTPAVGYDPDGLAYCTRGCEEQDCPEGYFCSEEFVAYMDAAIDVGDRACLRTQPTYSVGVGGPIHLVEPSISDINRSESLVTSPFEGEFIEIKQGNMIVTAVRIDGFYVSDVEAEEFNHLFIFNFNRPEDLFPGDKLISVAGPISEFNGLTELNFPLWEVDYGAGAQPIPSPVDLHLKVADVYPQLTEDRGLCRLPNQPAELLAILDCNDAMERLEAARVSVRIREIIPILPGSREEENFERFGQWPVIVETDREEYEIQLITRDNIPFFDPRLLPSNAQLGTVVGNYRQVAFDDRSDPIHIVEPRDQADCTACVN